MLGFGNTPRWFIFLLDLSISAISLFTAYLLRFNFHVPEAELVTWYYIFPYVLVVRAVCFYFFSSFAGIIRYTSTRDTQRVFMAVAAGAIFLYIANPVFFKISGRYAIPFSIVLIDTISTTFYLSAYRIAIKAIYNRFRVSFSDSGAKKVLIFGAGHAGMLTKRALDGSNPIKYKIVGFLDDNAKKAHRKLEGIKIYNRRRDLEDLLRSNHINQVIIAIQNLDASIKQEVVDVCLKFDTQVLHVPPVANWINGELNFRQIKQINIEDLLVRDPIKLDIDLIEKQLQGRRILITGAAGSIGSEIARQVLRFILRNSYCSIRRSQHCTNWN